MDLSQENGLTQFKPEGLKPTAPAFALIPLADVAAANIAAGLSDYDIARWLSRAPYPYTIADAQAYQAGCGDTVRAIVVDGQFVGIIGIKPDLGYWLSRPFWGQGLASAAAQRLLAHHFFSSDAPIVSGHFVGNGPSARVLARLGFRYTHVESVVPLSTGVKTRLERMVLDRAAWWAVHGLPIVTPRLLLRPMSASDASDFHALVTRPEVARMLFMFSADWPFAKAVPFLEDWRWQGRGRFRLAIMQNGDWAGWIGTDDAAEPEVFYALRPEFAGQGVAQEALRGFCQFLFATFSPLALRAGVFTDNPASANVLRRCGFAQVAEVMGHSAGRAAPALEWRFRLEQTDLPA